MSAATTPRSSLTSRCAGKQVRPASVVGSPCRTCAGHSGMATQSLQLSQTSFHHGDVEVAHVVPASEAARPQLRWHSVSSTHEYERCPRR